MSFAIIIEPIKVIVIRSKKSVRRLPAKSTNLRAQMVKNFIFLRAHTTAKVRKRQESVFQSKYVKYSLSGCTKNAVTNAAKNAMKKRYFS